VPGECQNPSDVLIDLACRTPVSRTMDCCDRELTPGCRRRALERAPVYDAGVVVAHDGTTVTVSRSRSRTGGNTMPRVPRRGTDR